MIFHFIVIILFFFIFINLSRSKIKTQPPKKYLRHYQGTVKNDQSIFISLASYRDIICIDTVKQIYENAHKPQLIYIGICQQNKRYKEDCLQNFCIKNRLCNNIKIIRLNYNEARGPCYARYLCSCLYGGQTYFLQIDSHTKFVKHWDEKMIKMMNTLPFKSGITYYPQPLEMTNHQLSIKKDRTNNTVPRICGAKMNKTKMFEFVAKEFTLGFNKSFGLAGGFLFIRGEALIETPYDPNLDMLFMGEEILYFARLYTRGWDLFTPNENIAYHWYIRKNQPRFQNDLLLYKKSIVDPKQTVMKKLGYYGKSPDIGKYGLGTVRSIDDFWNHIGIDKFNMNVIHDNCK